MTSARGVVDAPAATELLSLVADFLTHEVAPVQADAQLRLRVLVAANLLRTAGREFDPNHGFEVDRDGYAVPPELLAQAGSLLELAAELLNGKKSLIDPKVFALLDKYVEGKLKVSAPELLDSHTQDSSGSPGQNRS